MAYKQEPSNFTIFLKLEMFAFFLSVTSLMLITGSASAQTRACNFPGDQTTRYQLEPEPLNQSTAGISNTSAFAQAYTVGVIVLQQRYYEPIPPDAESRFSVAAKSVGRINILREANGVQCTDVCTGWLISDDLVATAAHCVRENADEGVTKITLLMGQENSHNLKFYDINTDPVEYFPEMGSDFAILRATNGTPGIDFGRLELYSGDIRVSHSLAIIGHPYGLLKQVVRAGCAGHPSIALDEQFLLHTCNTLPGMSGAPILDEASAQVVAVHLRGERDTPYDYNSGISVDYLVDKSQKLRELYSEPISLRQVVNEPEFPAEAFDISFGAYGQSEEVLDDITFALIGVNNILSLSECNFQINEELTTIHKDLGVVSSQSQFEALSRFPGDVKIVESIAWCGAPGQRPLGCSQIGGNAIVTRSSLRMPHVLLHELGHSAGLRHDNDSSNVMSLTFTSETEDSTLKRLNPEQCSLIRNYFAARK